MRICQSLLTRQEFHELIAYEQLVPWGEERMDARFAKLMALILNCARPSAPFPAHPRDFMPDFLHESPHRQSPEEQTAALDRFFAASAGHEVDADTPDADIEAYVLQGSQDHGEGMLGHDEDVCDDDETEGDF